MVLTFAFLGIMFPNISLSVTLNELFLLLFHVHRIACYHLLESFELRYFCLEVKNVTISFLIWRHVSSQVMNSRHASSHAWVHEEVAQGCGIDGHHTPIQQVAARKQERVRLQGTLSTYKINCVFKSLHQC